MPNPIRTGHRPSRRRRTRTSSSAPPARLRDARRRIRAWRFPAGKSSALRSRARFTTGRPILHFRRSDERARHRIRARDQGEPGRLQRRPHHVRDRAPPEHGPRRRLDRRARAGPVVEEGTHDQLMDAPRPRTSTSRASSLESNSPPASSDVPVVLLGEIGTGKALLRTPLTIPPRAPPAGTRFFRAPKLETCC